MDITKLSARKLDDEKRKREARHSAALDATIAAGMGDMRYSDIADLAKGSSLLSKVCLAREYILANNAMREVWSEEDSRKQYHGSTKPIKRQSH